jgi:hypothetical protein
MSITLVKCCYCSATGDFLKDEFEQVVLRYEEGYDWTGRLEVVCKDCAAKFKEGKITTSPEGDEILPLKDRLAVVLAWQYANDEPSTGEMWKKKYPEGTRWVKDLERVKREAEERRKMNELLVERVGMTLSQIKEKRFQEARYGKDPVLRVFACMFGGRNYGD